MPCLLRISRFLRRFCRSAASPGGGLDSGLTGGAISYTGGTSGVRPTWEGRNIWPGHPTCNIDLRMMRDFAIRERLHLQMIGEAFNLFNHTNIFSENETPYIFTNVGTGACTSALAAGTNGCLVPSPTFQAPTSTTSTNGLYGSRQLQFSAKIVF